MSDLRQEIENLRGELADAEAIIRNLDESNKALLDQRTTARAAATVAEHQKASYEAAILAANTRASAAGKLAVQLRLELARKDGYIDRVRENDDVSTTAIRNPAPGELLDEVRHAMAQVDEVTFDRIVSSMSQETLDNVMGKTNGEQSDILR